jgi:hypothetical protein
VAAFSPGAGGFDGVDQAFDGNGRNFGKPGFFPITVEMTEGGRSMGIAHLVSLRTVAEWIGTVAIMAPHSDIAGTIRRLANLDPAAHTWSQCR